jgi:glutathione synthase/RimK-type ligase-like ATP-grasp enzyme
MRIKTVLILYDKNNKSKGDNFPIKYESLYKHAEKKGALFCRASIASFDEKNKIFKKAQFFDGKHWSFKKNIAPDIIYDKSNFYVKKGLALKRKMISQNYPFYNPLKLSELLSNKWMTYKEFKDFSPKAFLISGKKDLPKIKKLSSEKVILKPLTGSGGKGIKIFNKDKIVPVKYPFFCQELIEVKKRSASFAGGAHDLRVIMINEKPFYSFLRIPKENKLISNLSQGGSVKVIPLKKLPKSIFPFVKKIQKSLRKYGKKIYSIDMIVDDNKRPWIIEMNSRPGIILEKEELPYQKYFFDNLVNFFQQIK